MKFGKQRSTLRWLAPILAVCAVTITVWFSARVAEIPDYGPQFYLCGGSIDTSSCLPTTEEFYVCGGFQKLSVEHVTALLFLFLMSLLCFSVMADRWLRYTLAGKQSKEFISRIASALHENRVDKAIALSSLYPASPVASVVNAGLSDQQCFRGAEMKPPRPSMQARHRAIVFETEDLRSGLWALAALGWIIPLVGFFLLVTGVIEALSGMKVAEGTGMAAIAGALAESLRPTVFSTLVAIPVIWSNSYFKARVDTFSLEMDRLSLAIIDQIVNQQQAVLLPAPRADYITRGLKSRATQRLTV